MDLTAVPKAQQAQLKNDIGQFLVEQILLTVGSAKSPVIGEDWPQLSKDYKIKKKQEGLPAKANLEESGAMLNALDYKNTRNGIEIGIFGKEAWKADGHLKFSGEKNNIPQRRFIPAEGQSFKKEIESEIENMIADARVESEDFSKSDLKQIETKSELYTYLEDKFPDMSDSEIRFAVLRNPDLIKLLDDLDLLDLL